MRTRRSTLFQAAALLAASLLHPLPAQASTVRVEGVVYEDTAQGLIPVAGADVLIFGVGFSSTSTTTDSSGYYVFDGLVPANADLTVKARANGLSGHTTTTAGIGPTWVDVVIE